MRAAGLPGPGGLNSAVIGRVPFQLRSPPDRASDAQGSMRARTNTQPRGNAAAALDLAGRLERRGSGTTRIESVECKERWRQVSSVIASNAASGKQSWPLAVSRDLHRERRAEFVAMAPNWGPLCVTGVSHHRIERSHARWRASNAADCRARSTGRRTKGRKISPSKSKTPGGNSLQASKSNL